MVEECNPLKVKYDACIKENLKGQFQSLYQSFANLRDPKVEVNSPKIEISSDNDQCEKLFSDYKSCYEIGMKLAIERRKKTNP
mmetsp:Transcript_6666/g.9937  ORF Transcript_6666/g.9937 Transcript_6666/m.9937 type:complete len:83 (+) Transcript_6666:24-272(+)